MIVAKVVDNIWSTKKADSLVGTKFVLVKIIDGVDEGRHIVAADTIGAGVGERVIICTGSSARKMFTKEDLPIDAAILGIIDEDCTFDSLKNKA